MSNIAVFGNLDDRVIRHVEQIIEKASEKMLIDLPRKLTDTRYVGTLENINLEAGFFKSNWHVFAVEDLRADLRAEDSKEYTIGIVLRGSRELYVKDKKQFVHLGSLMRGSVYVLHNETPHVVRQVNKKENPLILLTTNITAKSFEDALKVTEKWFREINKSIDAEIRSCAEAENYGQDEMIEDDASEFSSFRI